MLIFGHFEGEKTGFSVVTFLRKIITYSPERFSDSSTLVLSFHVVPYEFRGIKRCNQGEVCLKLLCIPSLNCSFFRQQKQLLVKYQHARNIYNFRPVRGTWQKSCQLSRNDR